MNTREAPIARLLSRAELAISLIRGLLRTGRIGVRIGRGVRLRGGGSFDLSKGSVIGAHTDVYVAPGAILRLKERSGIGGHSHVNVRSKVEIGEGTRISWRCQILDTDFHDLISGDGSVGIQTLPVSIGPDVLIGTGVIILKGVSVGRNSVIGAGSVVHGSLEIPPGSLVSGNPARVRRQIKGWIP